MSSFFSPIRIARLMHMPKKFSSLWIYFLYVALWTCTVEFLPAVFVHKFPFGPRKTFLALRKVLHLDHESKIHRRVIIDLVCNLCCPVNSFTYVFIMILLYRKMLFGVQGNVMLQYCKWPVVGQLGLSDYHPQPIMFCVQTLSPPTSQ